MRMLMGLDASKFTESTIKAVVAQCRPENVEVMLLHVLQPIAPAPPQMDAYFAPELETEKKAADEFVQRAATELREAGFKTETKVEVGDIREGILDCATDWGADLIVLGSHGQRGLGRWLLGSVSEFVARHAKCSVEIVRNGRVH